MEKAIKWGEYKLTVLETMLDFMGHVNNAMYLELFEEARWDFITRNGYGYNKIQETQKGPIILEVNLKYLKELSLREEITIVTELLSYKGRAGSLSQKILKSSGEVAAEAVFVFGLLDINLRSLILPTPDWAAAVGLASDR